MAAQKQDEKQPERLEAPRPDTFSEPLAPEGEGRITVVTIFPVGEYRSRDGVTVKNTGTKVTREQADALIAEAPTVVREIKPEKKES